MTAALDSGSISFDIGTLVNVQSRTWAGINKPGGVGRVTSFNNDDCTVDVKYVLGGGEKGIDLEFVQEHKFEGGDNGNGGRGRTRRQRQPDSNSININEKPNARKKRALKDGSNSANKLKGTEKEQEKESKSGVKRKAVEVKEGERKKEATPKQESKKQKIIKNKEKQISNKVSKNKITPILTQETTTDGKVVVGKAAKLKVDESTKTKQVKTREGKDLTEKKLSTTSSIFKSPILVASAQKNIRTASPETTNSDRNEKQLKIRGATKVLKHVYKDMSDRATCFVKEIVGKTNEATVKKEPKNEFSTPSSPDSTSSLEIRMEDG